MSDAFSTYEEVMTALKNGRTSDLERLCRVLPDFPHGRDMFIERHWIINAIDCGSIESVVWMLNRGVSLKICDEGFTGLHACIERRESADKYELLRKLIAAGADVNAYGVNGWTPLHMAAAYGDLEAVEILMIAGADPNIKTEIDDYLTPAEEARSLGQHEAAKLIDEFK